MGDFWENKYQNAEKSIEFLKATHAEVLKGLHEEIENLQKQCSDYALRLSLQAPTALEKEEFDKKFRSYNSEYKKKDALINEQRKLIEERNRNVKSLEERIKTLERKHESELALREQQLKQLKSQLESQSLQIAQLTFQMHNTNKNKSSNGSLNIVEPIGVNLADTSSSSFRKPLSPKLKTNRSLFSQPLNKLAGVDSTPPAQFLTSQSQSSRMKAANSSPERKNPSESTASISNNDRLLDLLAVSESQSNEAILANRRSSNSNSSSARSDRSASPTPVQATTTTKVLPPVIKRTFENVPSTADPMPFLNSTASTLHLRSKKDFIQKRTLIALPPIKPFEISQFAVESPLKATTSGASATSAAAPVSSMTSNIVNNKNSGSSS